MKLERNEPLFAIGIVARMFGVHQHTLRNYERWGMVSPNRSARGTRYYCQADLERIGKIREWMDVLGLNRAGVDVMIRLHSRITDLENEVASLKALLEQHSDQNQY